MKPRLLLSLLCAGLAPASLLAVGNITGTVSFTASYSSVNGGHKVSDNFTGLSFETQIMDSAEGFLTGSNTQLSSLLSGIGVATLRIGGGSVDTKTYNTDFTNTDIDNLFAFAGNVGANVIFGIRLLNGSTSLGKTEAQYVFNNHGSALDFITVGNEPNWHSYHTYENSDGTWHTADPLIAETVQGPNFYVGSAFNPSTDGYLADWNNFATTAAGSTAMAFGGPDTGDENGSTTTWIGSPTKTQSWTEAFVKSSSITVPLTAALQHNYPCGAEPSTASAAITGMLAQSLVSTTYPALESSILSKLGGSNWQMTECNDHTVGTYSGTGASDCFAGALWAIDYLNWWATKDTHCLGVNFHCNYKESSSSWLSTSVIDNSTGSWTLRPKGQAMQFFNLAVPGAHIIPATVSIQSNYNVAAYVYGDTSGSTVTDLYIMVVNKTNATSGNSQDCAVTIDPSSFESSGATAQYRVLYSTPDTNDVTAAGAAIGGWSNLSCSGNGTCTLTVNYASAALIHIKHN